MADDEIREIGGEQGREIARKPGEASPMSNRIREYFRTQAAQDAFMEGFAEGMAGSPFAQVAMTGAPLKDGDDIRNHITIVSDGPRLMIKPDVELDHDPHTCPNCQATIEAMNQFNAQEIQGPVLDVEELAPVPGVSDEDLIVCGKHSIAHTTSSMCPECRYEASLPTNTVDQPRENALHLNEEGTGLVEDVSLAGNNLLEASLRGDVGAIVRAAPTDATTPQEKGWTAQSARRQQHLSQIPDDETEAEYTARQIREQRAAAYAANDEAQREIAEESRGKRQAPTAQGQTTPSQDAGGEAQAPKAQPAKVPLTLKDLVGAKVIAYNEDEQSLVFMQGLDAASVIIVTIDVPDYGEHGGFFHLYKP